MMMDVNNGTMNGAQGQALTALVCAMRPDWDASGVLVALRQAADRAPAVEVIRAAVNAAATPTNRTPAVIPLAGPHWTTGKALGESRTHRGERCPEPFHTGSIHNCPQCRAEQIAVDVDAGETKAAPTERRASPEFIRDVLARARRGADIREVEAIADSNMVAAWSPTAGLPDEPDDDDPRRRRDWDR